jgi:hypothetical protein
MIPMQVARVRSMLWLTTVMAAAAAILAIAAASFLPLSLPSDVQIRSAAAPTNATAPATSAQLLPPLASFEPAWRLPLRRPLVDPAAVALVAADQSPKPAGLTIRLIGTIVDGQHPRGVFMSGLATVELKGIGEIAGGAKVLAIDDNSATLWLDGETFVLKRERNPFDSTGETYDAAMRSDPPAARLSSPKSADPKTSAGGGS